MPLRTASLLSLFAAACSLTAAPPTATAQTVRIYTNVGSFDMALNPTGLPDLERHVENLLDYIDSGRYSGTTINRAPQDFVLQMGSFIADSVGRVDSPEQYNPIEQFDDVVVDFNGDGEVDIDTGGLTNLRGTVSLALAGGDPNTGASSFFINIVDNTFLDDQGFIPFATISDMTVVDNIMALSRRSLDPSLTFSDVPFQDNGNIVVITGSEVVGQGDNGFTGPIGPSAPTAALTEMLAEFESTTTPTTPAFVEEDFSLGSPAFVEADPSAAGLSIPEPAGIALLGAAMAAVAGLRRAWG